MVYFISSVILVTLAIQLYWNYKNYQAGKQQLTNEVQNSLDNAIDSYYIDLADKNTKFFFPREHDSIVKDKKEGRRLQFFNRRLQPSDSLDTMNLPGFRILSRLKTSEHDGFPRMDVQFDTLPEMEVRGYVENPADRENYEQLVKRVIVAISIDSLKIAELNPYISEQLAQKNIDVAFGYNFTNVFGNSQSYNMEMAGEGVLNTTAKSAYLPRNSSFIFYFTNETATILKRNLLGMFLSALLMLSVIACLLFLLKIIRRQKQLSELKNDLIANITHEFKTPIATVKVALEGMENFNEENNPAKTKDYLQISRVQTDKLQTMVEKLLETATIDGNQLQLKKETFPLTQILRNLMGKYRNTAKNKVFHFDASPEDIGVLADPFHMENALNNILDNAVKYGGDKIKTSVVAKNGTVEILISDNGNNLSKTEAAQVFEKFYRVPRGNVHDVKGYGIGLYYTKNIIEKHGGSIRVILDGQTKFLVSLPNG